MRDIGEGQRPRLLRAISGDPRERLVDLQITAVQRDQRLTDRSVLERNPKPLLQLQQPPLGEPTARQVAGDRQTETRPAPIDANIPPSEPRRTCTEFVSRTPPRQCRPVPSTSAAPQADRATRGRDRRRPISSSRSWPVNPQNESLTCRTIPVSRELSTNASTDCLINESKKPALSNVIPTQQTRPMPKSGPREGGHSPPGAVAARSWATRPGPGPATEQTET